MAQLFDLPIQVASRWIFNCYVIESHGTAPSIVVDPGLACTATMAADLVRASNRDATERLMVLSTHGHSDHVGGIPRLLSEFAAEVRLPARCEAYLEGESARTPDLPEVVKILPVLADQPFDPTAARDFLRGADLGFGRTPRMQIPFAVDGFLRDGEVLTSAPGWEILHTPGHTDDSTCLYHRDTATLISGDAVLTHDGQAWLNPEVVDPDLATRTEARLRELDVRHLLPGHGRPLEGRHLLRDARSFRAPSPSRGALAGLARRFGRW